MVAEADKLEKARRSRLVAMILPAVVGSFTVTFVNEFRGEYMFYPIRPELLLVLGYGFVAFSALIVLMTYLQMGTKGFFANRSTEQATQLHTERIIASLQDELMDVKARLGRVLSQIENQPDGKITEDDRKEIASQLRTKISAETNEEIFAEFKEHASKNIEAFISQQDVREMLRISRYRLERELAALGWRGNLNLAFGAITTIIGLGILGASVYSEVVASKDIWSFASHFLPRLTLVIFIEIFAYFFLSLYRASLQEIKYFQNELTNVESKQAALIAAIDMDDHVAINKVLTALAETERNHVISKDQTTVELEKVRVDRASNNEMLKLFTELFKKNQGS
jgi:hypothetical protein